MLSQHVRGNLSAYCHGELPEEESRRVAEHLIGCQRCRREYEEIKLGVKLAEQLPRVPLPASLWSEIEAALVERSRPDASPRKPSRFGSVFGWQRIMAVSAVLLIALATAIFWYSRRQPDGASRVAGKDNTQQTSEPNRQAPETDQTENLGDENQTAKTLPAQTENPETWEVARLTGAPTVGANRIEGSGRLAVGEWLETDSASRAKINVADIGQVDIGPNSRVRLVGTRSTEHRLALQRGRLQARIDAPPRLFIVETPSAVAVDLGCAYTLDVDDAGRSVLHVMSGWVALEVKGRESIVPAGAVCVTEPGKGLGTPYFEHASVRFRKALARLDFQNGGAKALSIVLGEASEYDTLTLWHLLSRVRAGERGRVYDRLAGLLTPPKGVTREGILKLDEDMLELWKRDLEWAWFE